MKMPIRVLFNVNSTSLTFYSVLLAVALFLIGVPILDMIELKTYDLRFLSRGRLEPSSAIVMAVIDEKSLEREGRWPWPRTRLAKLVDILSEDGAKVIGFDIGFLEPDQNSQLELIRQLGQEIDALNIRHEKLASFINKRRSEADNDLALAKSIRNSSASVILGYFFQMSEGELDYRIEPTEIDSQLEHIRPSKYHLIASEEGDMPTSTFIRAYTPESNLEVLSQSTDSCGYFNKLSDPDGAVRWMPLIIQCGEDIYSPLSLQCAWHYLDRPQLVVKVTSYGVEGIQMGERFIPTDENGLLLVNYLGPHKTFPQFSISDILSGKFPEETFRGKIVLVGSTALGVHDLRNTPFSPVFPGVELHATIIDNILKQNFLSKPEWTHVFDLLAIIVLGSLMGLALPHLNAIRGVSLASGLFVLHIIAARWLFVHSRVWLNMVYPLLVVLITYIALTVYHYLTEERERRKVRNTFGRYVSGSVIEEMLKQPERLKLGGEEKVLSVLFCDLVTFTKYSEYLTPHAMVGLLADYFKEMTDQVFAFQGTLKEYVGDELMAIFGAPLEQQDHAERACSAALAMQDRLHELRQIWLDMDRPLLEARIGINSGPMLVGNLGSAYRFSYGALGDNVNLGSRLQGLNKLYGTKIMIGENTAGLVERSFLLRELDYVRVQGKERPVRVYELVARSGASLSEEKRQALSFYLAGLDAYRRQCWEEALENFNRIQALWPEDKSSRVMAGRCYVYQKEPPRADWDGVFRERRKT